MTITLEDVSASFTNLKPKTPLLELRNDLEFFIVANHLLPKDKILSFLSKLFQLAEEGISTTSLTRGADVYLQTASLIEQFIQDYQEILPEKISWNCQEIITISRAYAKLLQGVNLILSHQKTDNFLLQVQNLHEGLMSVALILEEDCDIFPEDVHLALNRLVIKLQSVEPEINLSEQVGEQDRQKFTSLKSSLRQSLSLILSLEEGRKEDKTTVIGVSKDSAPKNIRLRPASGRSLLRHAGTWEGDDIEDCRQKVYDTRSRF